MVGILKVVKHDDGTVQEVSLCADGLRKESFYSANMPGASHEPILAKPDGTNQEPRRHKGTERANPKQCLLYFGVVALHAALILAVVLPLNPLLLSKTAISVMGPNSYPIHCNRWRPEEFVRRCYDTFFCVKQIVMPEIATPAGTFYPNFTNDAGEASDYRAALLLATSLVTNPACSNVAVSTSDNATTSERNSTAFAGAADVMLEGLFILKYNCHPEAVALTQSLCGAWRHRFVDVRAAYQLNHSSCEFDWSGVRNATHHALLGPRCAQTRPEEADLYPDLFLFVERVTVS